MEPTTKLDWMDYLTLSNTVLGIIVAVTTLHLYLKSKHRLKIEFGYKDIIVPLSSYYADVNDEDVWVVTLRNIGDKRISFQGISVRASDLSKKYFFTKGYLHDIRPFDLEPSNKTDLVFTKKFFDPDKIVRIYVHDAVGNTHSKTVKGFPIIEASKDVYYSLKSKIGRRISILKSKLGSH